MRQIIWVPYSPERLRRTPVDRGWIAFVDGDEVGCVFALHPPPDPESDDDRWYGAIWDQRIGVCLGEDNAKRCVERHFAALMSGKPSEFWGRT